MPAFAGMTESETADLFSELLGQDTSFPPALILLLSVVALLLNEDISDLNN